MSRYRLSDKMRALDLLDDCDGDTAQASARSGIPADRLRRWARDSAVIRRQAAERQRATEARLMSQARLEIARKTLQLLGALSDAQLAKAPLHQLVGALGALIDRYLKLAQQSPDDPTEKVIRIEYQHPDGKIYPYPYWARHHPDIARAFQSGGVWPPLWQDRSGEADADRAGAPRQANVVASADLPDGWAGVARFEGDDQADERYGHRD